MPSIPWQLAESAVNPQLAEAVAAETGATLTGETLYTDSLGAPGSGADTLDGMLLHNARVIHEGAAWHLRAWRRACNPQGADTHSLHTWRRFRDGFRRRKH